MTSFIKLSTNPCCRIDLEYVNSSGENSLFIAAQKKHYECASRLIEAGIDINHLDTKGNTALYSCNHKEMVFGHSEVVLTIDVRMSSILLNSGINSNSRNDKGETVLLYYLNSGEISNIIQFITSLSNFGFDFNLQYNDGCTCLMRAAVRGDIKIAKELILAGADPTISNGTNTAFDYAVGHGRLNVIEYLRPEKNRESGNYIESKFKSMQDIVKNLSDRVASLELENKKLSIKLDCIYYKPGNKGYYETEENYKENLKEL